MIAKVEAAIERLQEYRTALITAAVTGKIDVRRHGMTAIRDRQLESTCRRSATERQSAVLYGPIPSIVADGVRLLPPERPLRYWVGVLRRD